MLKLIQTMDALDVGQLMAVYEQTNRLAGMERYPDLNENLQLLMAEQDFYSYLQAFFQDKYAVYALWAPGGVYKAAARLEQYRDGFLLAGLETALDAREKGYAAELVRAIQKILPEYGIEKLYSHVDKNNEPSLAVHIKCGFERIHDHAVFLDGSVSNSSCTFRYIK